MQTYPDCIPCLLQQALKTIRLCDIKEGRVFPVMKRILRCATNFDPCLSPPEMAMYIHRIIREECGNADPYSEMKQQAIAAALSHEDRIREVIAASQTPFLAAVRFALVGNVLDFAIFDWNPRQLEEQLEMALHQPIDETALTRLEKEVESATKIMVLGDNAGESVFDKLLIEQLGHKQVIYAVRGKPTINDVTMTDAIASGLSGVARLQSNGSDAPGTLLARVSGDFLHEFNSADLIIAKGQGNYESLSSSDQKIFFLTQIKCPVIASDLQRPVGDWVITESRAAIHSGRSE
jgi:uncharacterized protein with ATP-grasp and redox domains